MEEVVHFGEEIFTFRRDRRCLFDLRLCNRLLHPVLILVVELSHKASIRTILATAVATEVREFAILLRFQFFNPFDELRVIGET